ncbi:MAG: FecR domain-containing protein [Planctomycetes bacterium]|nr:FecR domain-containing protein [Planctomycetota bacterium]
MRNVKHNQPSDAPEPPGDGENEALAKLLRTAGPRLDPPRERRERAYAAVRREWQRVAKARRKRRYIVWGIASAAAAMVALAFLPSLMRRLNTPPDRAVAKFERVEGGVKIASKDGTRDAKAGESLLAGESLQTLKDGHAALLASGGESLRVDAEAKVRALSETAFQLESGRVYVDSGGKTGGVEIRTDFGNTKDIGTQFSVSLDGKLTVRVREGKVELKRGDEKALAAAGEELTAAPKVAIARAQVPVNGPLWDWAADLAPAFKMDGKPAKSYLEWVCHEKAWTLKYADAKAEAAASAIVLHGALESTSLDASLDAVLAVSGLSYRIKDNTLTVSQTE